MAQMFIVPNGIAEVFTQVKKAWTTQLKSGQPIDHPLHFTRCAILQSHIPWSPRNGTRWDVL